MKAALRIALAVHVAYAAAGVQAQPGRSEGPADPSAPAPSLKHESAFDGYRRFEEPKVAPWRAANEEVSALRGHIDHIKDAGTARDGTPAPQTGDSRTPPAPVHRHSN